jgi:hypothetical protein
MIPRCIHHQGVDLNWVQKICWCKIHHVVTIKVFCKSVLMVVQNTRCRLPGVFTTGELRLPGAFITGDSFVPLRSQFTDFKAHRTVYHSNYRLQVLLKLPRIMWFMFLKNCLTLGVLIDSPVYSSPGSQFWRQITLRIFLKKTKLFLGMPTGTKKSLLLTKTRDKNLITLSL